MHMIDSSTVLELARRRGEPDWLIERRMQALTQFESLPEPRFVYGIGIQVDASELDVDRIDLLQGTEEARVIAPPDVEVMTFTEALRQDDYAAIIEEHLMTMVRADGNRFTALHAACFNSGLLVRISKGVSCKEPIRINLRATRDAKLDHVLIVAQEQSSALIIEDTTCEDGATFHSKAVEIIAEDAARIDYVSIQELGDDVWHFSKKSAQIHADARVAWSDLALGGRFCQILTDTNLEGQGASSTTQGIFFGNGSQRFDIRCASRHQAKDTNAKMTTRTVLDGSAKAVYRGLIRIEKGADRTVSHQHSDTLLLGGESRADAVPELEIENDDVQCSHGATIGQIDEDKLFYMMSRGIDARTARRQVIKGFFWPILETVKDEQLRVNLDTSINRRLEVDA